MSKGRIRTFRGDRLHIGFFGRRNVGKSSLINAITGQPTAIVSEIPGTTTDPVYKAMELLPIGPVVLMDTAGLDDDNFLLGGLRKQRTKKVLDKTDLALVVVEGSLTEFDFEDGMIESLKEENIPFIIVLNKVDRTISPQAKNWLAAREYTRISAESGQGIDGLKEKIIAVAPRQWEPPFIKDLIKPGNIVVLVVPIDLGAPKGRIIMPQVKAIRDVLDGNGIPIICKESELAQTLALLKDKPSLVVTDSQVFSLVAELVPPSISVTSFSILSARQKGNLGAFIEAVLVVEKLRPGDHVLVAESCTHHPQADDIGRIKIPRWLNDYVGGKLRFDMAAGANFPENLSKYKLIIHCGACTLNRKEMLNRQQKAQKQGIPITNYGIMIAFLNSLFPRALEPLHLSESTMKMLKDAYQKNRSAGTHLKN